MADTVDLKSAAERREGSTPFRGTMIERNPPRCLDCSHTVGPTGEHFNVEATRYILCSICRGNKHHIMSMALEKESQKIFEEDRERIRVNTLLDKARRK